MFLELGVMSGFSELALAGMLQEGPLGFSFCSPISACQGYKNDPINSWSLYVSVNCILSSVGPQRTRTCQPCHSATSDYPSVEYESSQLQALGQPKKNWGKKQRVQCPHSAWVPGSRAQGRGPVPSAQSPRLSPPCLNKQIIEEKGNLFLKHKFLNPMVGNLWGF